jgi:hypothetical protein
VAKKNNPCPCRESNSGRAHSLVIILPELPHLKGAHPASYPTGTRGCFPGGKAAGAWRWPLTSIYCRGQRMSEAMPPLPNTLSWRGAEHKVQEQLYLYLPRLKDYYETGLKWNWKTDVAETFEDKANVWIRYWKHLSWCCSFFARGFFKGKCEKSGCATGTDKALQSPSHIVPY